MCVHVNATSWFLRVLVCWSEVDKFADCLWFYSVDKQVVDDHDHQWKVLWKHNCGILEFLRVHIENVIVVDNEQS